MEQLLENFYTEDEIDRIWKELKYLDSNTHGWVYPTNKRNATDKKGNLLLQGARQFDFQTLYQNCNISVLDKSNIFTLGKKIYKYHDFLYGKHDVYTNIRDCSAQNTFVNYYYKDDASYKLHNDISMYTLLSYFYEEPKNFTGGEFVVEDRKYEIHNGFTIIIPGWLKHGSTPIKIIDKSRKQSGRYSIAHFFWSVDSNDFERK